MSLYTSPQFDTALQVSWVQASLVFKARCLEDCFSGAGLKSWSPVCGIMSPLLLSEKLQVLSSLLVVGHLTVDGIYGAIVS